MQNFSPAPGHTNFMNYIPHPETALEHDLLHCPYTSFILAQLAPLLFSTKPAVLLNPIPTFTWSVLKFPEPLADLIKPVSSYQFNARERQHPLLLYRPDRLHRVLSREENMRFLSGFGYPGASELLSCLAHWQRRLASGFPHETGIFLGIPLDDVRSFIHHQGKHYLFNRYWKVYHQPEQAGQTFRAYDCAKERLAQIMAGIRSKEPTRTGLD